MITVVAGVLFGLGLGFILVAVIGILRLPDFYTRLHAMGKCDTLGIVLVLVALAMHTGVSLDSVKILFIAVFVWLANPTATHVLGRAALKAGLVPWQRPEEQR
jgi:multicomponent Na+:H+ antiporter subunit G